MFKGKPISKVVKKLSKEKCINIELPTDRYFYGKASYFNTEKGTMWVLEPVAAQKFEERESIVNTLIDIGFKRGNKKWTQYMVVAFITEVYDNYVQNDIKAIDISERYNVPINKLESTVSMFFSLHRTRYCLQNFFTQSDFTLWRFRNIKTFDKLKKQNKVSYREIKILEKCGMIEFDSKCKKYVSAHDLLDIMER